MVDNKKKIENVIIRAFKGDLTGTEVENIRKNLMNYNLAEWRELIQVGKELAKEKLDEEISKISGTEFSSEYKSLARDTMKAMINLVAAIFNEDFFHQLALLDRQSGLSDEEKVKKMLPIIAQRMDKIAARVPSHRPANYYKAEGKVNSKFKKIFREVKTYMFKKRLLKGDKEKIKQKVGQFLDMIENLTVEEIYVVKDKLKSLANMIIDNYAPSQIKNSPEIRQTVNSFLKLLSALGDEKLIKDALNLAVKLGRIELRNPELIRGEKVQMKYFTYYKNDLVSMCRKAGLEGEFKKLWQDSISHMNKLVSEDEKNNSLVNQEEVIQKLVTQLPDQPDNPSEEENNNPNPKVNFSLGSLFTDNALVKAAENSLTNTQGGGSPSKEWNLEEVFKDTEKLLTTHQEKRKWYQNPWVIGGLVLGAFLVGGLVVWLFLRKKNQPVKEE